MNPAGQRWKVLRVPAMTNHEYIPAQEALALTGWSRQTINRRVHAGLIRSRRNPLDHRYVEYRREDLDAILTTAARP